MSEHVRFVTDEQVESRMREILERLNMSEEELTRRADAYLLDREERHLFDQYVALQWLAGVEE